MGHTQRWVLGEHWVPAFMEFMRNICLYDDKYDRGKQQDKE